MEAVGRSYLLPMPKSDWLMLLRDAQLPTHVAHANGPRCFNEQAMVA